MHVGFLQVKPGPTEAEFQEVCKEIQGRMEGYPGCKTTFKRREGINAKGNQYVYLQCVERGENGKEVFVGTSVTWSKEKRLVVQVILEGVPKMQSQAGRASEMRVLEKSAEDILLSLD